MKDQNFNLYFYVVLILGIFSGVPYSLTIMSASVSVNYLYFLFFFIFLFKENFFFKKNSFWIIILFYFVFIFFFNFINLKIDIIFLRKFVSFIFFIVPFFFFFFVVKKTTVESLKLAIIITSIIYGLLTIYWYYQYLYNLIYIKTDLGALKHYVGGSRMGFFHLVAFYLIVEKVFLTKNKIYYLLFFINTAAIYNTYSRTALVALTLSFFIFITIASFNKDIFQSKKKFFILLLIILLNLPLFHKTTKFYNTKFVKIIANTTSLYLKQEKYFYIDKYLKNIVGKKDNNENVEDKLDLSKEKAETSSILKKILDLIFLQSLSKKNLDIKQKELNLSIFQLENNKTDKVLEFKNRKSSEGYRIYIWNKILNYLIENKKVLTGSGYIGTFVVDSNEVFSAHSQYVDIFFRTGLIGLIIMLFIYLKFLIVFYKKNIYLFSSFIAVLLYGLFHETFKQSQGGFLFIFFIISYIYENYQSKGLPKMTKKFI